MASAADLAALFKVVKDGISKREMNCTTLLAENFESIFSSVEKSAIDKARDTVGIVRSKTGYKFSAAKFYEFLNCISQIETSAHAHVDRCVGSYMGMVLGDYLGAPIEFLNAKDKSNSIKISATLADGFKYPSETKNPFRLQLGQWTDDASMGACMADSLLVKPEFSGRDIRSRFWNWCNVGYNNAFMLDKSRDKHRSVGLGGNISKSIYAMNGLAYGDIPDKYLANTEDSGNGGLMRLAPIPVYYSKQQIGNAMAYGKASSETTHPGAAASRTAEFLTFLIHRAINRPEQSTPREFLDESVRIYLENFIVESDSQDLLGRLLRALEGRDSKELSWNWREETLQIERCCRLRGDYYNGYPNSLSYYGSYCMDGLAVALNAFYWGNSFASTLERCINHRGDADSTGSIAGQIAGAFYGMSSIDEKLVSWAVKWDKGDNILRAVLLSPWCQDITMGPQQTQACTDGKQGGACADAADVDGASVSEVSASAGAGGAAVVMCESESSSAGEAASIMCESEAATVMCESESSGAGEAAVVMCESESSGAGEAAAVMCESESSGAGEAAAVKSEAESLGAASGGDGRSKTDEEVAVEGGSEESAMSTEGNVADDGQKNCWLCVKWPKLG